MPTELRAYIRGFFVKILENMASAKVWFFLLPFFASTAILVWLTLAHIKMVQISLAAVIDKEQLLENILSQMKTITDTFIAWCTFNVSLTGTIVVVRETFKVSKIKQLRKAGAIEEIRKVQA